MRENFDSVEAGTLQAQSSFHCLAFDVANLPDGGFPWRGSGNTTRDDNASREMFLPDHNIQGARRNGQLSLGSQPHSPEPGIDLAKDRSAVCMDGICQYF